jgi:hypothetical protein
MLEIFSSGSVRYAGEAMFIESSAGRIGAWVVVLLLLVGFAFWAGWKGLSSMAGIAGGVSLVIAIVAIPGIWIERVAVRPTSMDWIGGVWFAPTRKTFSFKNLESVGTNWVKIPQRGLPRKDLRWSFRYLDGRELDLTLPDLMIAHDEEIAAFLKKSGIEIFDKGGESR